MRFLDFRVVRSTLVAGLMLIGLAAQAETVRWLHIEQNADVAAFYADVAKRFEAANPGTKVEIQYLENESYKKKLTTLLQSPDKPHIIYSWAGGVLREQVKAGVIEDITDAGEQRGWRDRFNPAALSVYTDQRPPVRRADADVAGRLLLQQGPVRQGRRRRQRDQDLGRPAGSGEEAAGRRHHADRHRRRRQVAAALLLVAPGDPHRRQAGVRRRACAARARASPAKPSCAPARLFKELVDLKPFQAGFLAATYPQSAGQFGDGKGAMMLMLNGLLNTMKANAADKIGIPDDKMGWFAFPSVPGGKGAPDDTLGGMNGWLVTKGSPKEAVEFLKFFTDAQNQRLAAERGYYIPVVNGATESVKRPLLRMMAENVGALELPPAVLRPDARAFGGRRGQRHLGRPRRRAGDARRRGQQGPAGLAAGQLTAAAAPAPRAQLRCHTCRRAHAGSRRLVASARGRRPAADRCGARSAVVLLFLPPALLLFTLLVALPMAEAGVVQLLSLERLSAARASSSACATFGCCSTTPTSAPR